MKRRNYVARIVLPAILIAAIMIYLFIHRTHFAEGMMDAINACR